MIESINTPRPSHQRQCAYYAKSAVGPLRGNGATHPLWRRMTWTGKAIVEALAQWESAHNVKLADIAKDASVAVYYGTYFGEIEAGLIVAEGILKPREHVVSPTAFQQSVHNAPVADLMQVLQCDAPTATITSGAGSFDRALHLASQDLLVGACDVAIVVGAAEYHLATSESDITAEAEICVLSQNRKIGPHAHWNIESSTWTHNDVADPETKTVTALASVPLNLDARSESFLRKTDMGHGRTLTTSWQREIPGLNGTAAMELLPHRDPMLLVDRLIEAREDCSAWVQATLRPDSVLFDHGTLQTHWLIEVLAQATGVAFNASKYFAKGKEKAAVGYLLSVDYFDASGSEHCKPEDVLDIHVVLEANIFPLGKYNANAYHRGVLVAKAKMKFLSDESGEVALTGRGFT